jgi:transposase
MPASEAAPSMITIEFAGGARMKIEGAPDAKILASVIGALSKAER